MSRTLKLSLIAVLACVCQTNLSQYIRIAGVAPDLIIVFLVLITSYTGAYGGFCTGALTAMLYDASVGYVLAINLVGYTFIGWAKTANGNVINNVVTKLASKYTNNEEVTLYAVWNENSYLVKYDANSKNVFCTPEEVDKVTAISVPSSTILSSDGRSTV